ncbi:hypothetical protein [Modestobacter sp. I12A-02662]
MVDRLERSTLTGELAGTSTLILSGAPRGGEHDEVRSGSRGRPNAPDGP